MSLESARSTSPIQFGTYKGVYLPCIVTIVGVVIYLRMGWMVANATLLGALIIIALGIGISFLTVLSISSIATNMRVGGGGAYYIISRALGLEAGAAIGIPLYVSQVIGIAFYLAGFAETIRPHHDYPDWAVSLVSLTLLAVVSNVSTKIAMRMQAFILILLIISFISFFAGFPSYVPGPTEVEGPGLPSASFWQVFAVFFPGCTGIVAGIALSGELKDPRVSIPRGTILALMTGLVLFVSISVSLAFFVPTEILANNSLVMQQVALFPILVIIGIFGATLSSAINNLVGAPRTIKALADDRVLPSWLGKESGKDREPQVAAFITFLLAAICIFIGDVNTLAAILTMFFLTAFTALNLIAGLEGLFSNPSWRPSFKISWQLSLIGALLSLFAMLMINSGVAIIAIIVCFLIYQQMRKRGVYAHWNDMRRSIFNFLAQASIYRMEDFDEDPKTWRPNILVFSGSPTSRMYLIDLAEAISHSKGFLTVCTVLTSELPESKIQIFQKSIQDFLAKQQISALTKVVCHPDYFSAADQLVQFYGLGKVTPNTFIFGETMKQQKFIPFARMIRNIHQAHKNVLIVREDHRPVVPMRKRGPLKRIDIWWERESESASFKLTLAYMLQNSQEWMGSRLVLKSLANREEEKEGVREALEKFIEESRTDVEVQVFVIDPETNDFDDMRRFSQDADLVFIEMRPPLEEETDEQYAQYYHQLLLDTHHFPELVICLKGETIDFKQIFT